METANKTYSSVVTLLTFSGSHILGIRVQSQSLGLHGLVPSSILALEVDVHEEGEAEAHGDSGNEESVTGVVARSILGAVGKSRDNTAKVTEA